MSREGSKLDQLLIDELDGLADHDEIDALVYPTKAAEQFEEFLRSRRDQGQLEFNPLPMAGCVVVKTTKQLILEIASRPDVLEVKANPRFSTAAD